MSNCILTRNKELSLDLLWTNPNPTNSFPAQTLSLDLSNYDMVIIYFRYFTDGYNCYISQVCLKDITTTLHASARGGTNGIAVCRRDVTVSDNSVLVAVGYYDYNGVGEDNRSNIPLKIYGVK